MDEQTQRLIDSLTDEQIREVRRMMGAVLPIFKVFAQALIGVLNDEQKEMLQAITDTVDVQ